MSMRLETLPLLLGGAIGLIGLTLVWDAWAADTFVAPERRQRPRRERDRGGEFLVGLGTIAMGAAFIGRDTWRWDTVAVIAGALLLLIGAVRNRAYIREVFSGGSRRRVSPADEVTEATPLTASEPLAEGARRIR
jgi:hypothetical protein